jgi:uncharacterized protein (DUF952 family)
MSDSLIYHMCRRGEWQVAERAGAYQGSSQDISDGFIHFSTAAQLATSAAKHRAGQSDLVLVAVAPTMLGEALRWETAGNGALFPHVYGALPLSAVRWVRDLPLAADGRHRLPALD